MFNDFLEGEITFPPTYKYDLFSDDFDTSEKCRAPAWTDRVLWRRRVQQTDSENPNWNFGNLLFYGRAELKQSDHRPVIAIIDIEFSQIDVDKRHRVFNEVIQDLGPPDNTIVISPVENNNRQTSDDEDEEDSIYDENVTAALVQELAEIGEVTLVRFVGETMWVTFKDGQAALSAANRKANLQVCGVNLTIKLKTEDWVKQAEKEIYLCTTNCVQLCDYIDVSASSDYNSLGIPAVPSEPMNKMKPPTRPPLPKSPNTTPKHQRAGIVNVSDIIRPQPQLPDRPCLPPRPKAMEIPLPSAMERVNDDTNYQAPSAIYEEIQDDIVSEIELKFEFLY